MFNGYNSYKGYDYVIKPCRKMHKKSYVHFKQYTRKTFSVYSNAVKGMDLVSIYKNNYIAFVQSHKNSTAFQIDQLINLDN